MFAAHFTPGIFNPKLQPWTIHKVAKSHFTNFQFEKKYVLTKRKSHINDGVAWMGHKFYYYLNLTLYSSISKIKKTDQFLHLLSR